MSTLLRGQEQASAKRPLPVNDTNMSSQVSTSSSATVQLYYYNAGVRTTDAGQAAGTVIDGVFLHKNILTSLGTTLASKNDTSLAYTCDALTTELDWESRPDIMALWEGLDSQSNSVRATQIGALLASGEFIVDYRRGMFIGKKATTTATMTGVTYKYSTGVIVDSEMPPAAALADASVNPTTTQVGANMLGFNGTTWDRIKAGVTTVTSTLTGWLNTMPWAIYHLTPTTRTDGQGGPLETDTSGNLNVNERLAPQAENNTDGTISVSIKPLAVSTYAWSTDVSAALEASTVAKASAGCLRSATVRLDATAANGTYYIQFLNAASLPADGAVTHLCAPIKKIHTNNTDDLISVDFADSCIYASTGIVMCLSTTEFTKTIAGAYTSSTISFK